MFRRVPMVETIYRTATAASTYVIQGPVYAAGQVLHIEAIGYTNEDSNNKDICVGIRVGSADVWLYPIEGGTAGVYVGSKPQITIRSECRLIFRVISPGAGDRTIINVVGYFLDVQ